MDPFLRATEVIDFGHSAVRALAAELAGRRNNPRNRVG